MRRLALAARLALVTAIGLTAFSLAPAADTGATRMRSSELAHVGDVV